MSERTQKRKRSLQDSTVDLSKVRMALNRLEALKEELDGIEETEEELSIISEHLFALENIPVKGAKKPVCRIFRCILSLLLMMLQRVTFSTVTSEDLKKAGVERKRLVLCPRK
jgi:hypothetical protein